MNSWLALQFAKYGAIATGLAIGTAAKYGLAISEGRRITWRGIIGDILLLGMLAVLALNVVDRFGLSGNAAVLCGSLFAMGSDRVVRLVRDQFMRRAVFQLDGPATETKAGEVVIVPAGNGQAKSAELALSRHPDARAAGVERPGERSLPKSNDDFDKLIDRIDEADKPKD